MKTTSTTWGWR